MTEICKAVVRDHLVRKGERRKAAFRGAVRAAFRERGIFLREERATGLVKNTNLVAGNVRTADIIVSAHYDTCAELPFPNFAAPLNIAATVVCQLALYALFVLAALALSRFIGAFAWMALLLLPVLLMLGPANPNTMNDNTSGVVAALTLLERMTPNERGRCAVVLFDNEELGLIGSTLFRRRYAKFLADKPLVNLDCVGDGEYMLFAANKRLRADEALYARVRAAFPDAGDMRAMHVPAHRALYPSDQMGFPMSVAVAALRKRRGLGYAIGRIHTRRDTVLDERNIKYLVEGLLTLIRHEDE